MIRTYLTCSRSYERCCASQSDASHPKSLSRIAGNEEIIPGTDEMCSPHRVDVGFRAIHIVRMKVHTKRTVFCIVASAGIRCKVILQPRRV